MTESTTIENPSPVRYGGVLADFPADEAGLPLPPEAPSLRDAVAYTRSLATGHYENFSVLSRLVPAGLRDDFAAVYAFCRWADDLGDETGAGEAGRAEASRLLAWWRGELDGCFRSARGESAEQPRHPVFVALADTAKRRCLAPEPFHHLIDAFEMDQRVARYETWDDVLGYCRLSADPVGRIVLALAGHDGSKPGDAERFAMSDATCSALQLINHWQDVRRDLIERDRVYLPAAETGLSAEDLREMLDRGDDPAARVRYIRAVRPLVERTRVMFRAGRPLPRTLEPSIAPVVRLFGAGGEATLAAVERIGCATLWERPRLTRSRKAWLVGVAATRAALMRGSR